MVAGVAVGKRRGTTNEERQWRDVERATDVRGYGDVRDGAHWWAGEWCVLESTRLHSALLVTQARSRVLTSLAPGWDT